MPSEAGWEGQLLIPPGMPTVASILKEAGYRTAYFGKWHLGWGISDPGKPRSHRSDWEWNAGELKPGVLECGFDRYFGTPFSANEPPFVFVDQRTVVDRDPNDPIFVTGPKETKEGFGWGVSSGAAAARTRPDRWIRSIFLYPTRCASSSSKTARGHFSFNSPWWHLMSRWPLRRNFGGGAVRVLMATLSSKWMLQSGACSTRLKRPV